MNTAAVVVTALVAVLVLLRIVGWVFGRRSAETLDFRGPVRALDVALGTGQVTIRGSGRRDARVRRTLRHGLRRPRLTEVVDDGVLRLRVPSGVVHYEIDVPAATAVRVAGRTASTTVIGIGGRVELDTRRGSLEGRALACTAVHAATSTGSIRLSFDVAPDVVEVATDQGTVELVLPAGDTDVRARTPEPVRVLAR